MVMMMMMMMMILTAELMEHLETISRTLSHKGLSPTHAYVYTYMYLVRIYCIHTYRICVIHTECVHHIYIISKALSHESLSPDKYIESA